MSLVPQCPECLRTNQRSIVCEAGRSKVSVGPMKVTTTRGTTSTRAATLITITYRCTHGHLWSETDEVKAR